MEEKLKRKYKSLLIHSKRPIAVATLYFLVNESKIGAQKTDYILKVTERFLPIKRGFDKHSGKFYEYLDFTEYPQKLEDKIIHEYEIMSAVREENEIDLLIDEMDEIWKL